MLMLVAIRLFSCFLVVGIVCVIALYLTRPTSRPLSQYKPIDLNPWVHEVKQWLGPDYQFWGAAMKRIIRTNPDGTQWKVAGGYHEYFVQDDCLYGRTTIHEPEMVLDQERHPQTTSRSADDRDRELREQQRAVLLFLGNQFSILVQGAKRFIYKGNRPVTNGWYRFFLEDERVVGFDGSQKHILTIDRG